MTDRVLLISSDCHIDFPLGRAKEYLETAYHDEFDRYFAAYTASTGDEVEKVLVNAADWRSRDGFQSPVDLDIRLKGLDANGVAGEVLIPNFWTIPFFPTPGQRGKPGFDPEQYAAGCRAYNRWLAEFVDPDRQAALAQITCDDVPGAVAEIRNAKKTGMRGVSLDGQLRDLPPYFDDYYEPIWAALEEEQLTATFHGGAGYDPEFETFGTGPVAANIMFMEVLWNGHRPLWFLLYGGVLERHPGLGLVFTEQNSDWVPGTMNYMDYNWHRKAFVDHLDSQKLCPLPPRDYWARQCYVGASLLSSAELAMRYEIGVDNMMFGTDFAHPEGTWNQTLEHLQALFGAGGVSEDETRRILGENAARVYHFDVEKLAPVVDRVGYTIEEVLTAPTGELDPHVASSVGRVVKGW